MLTMAENNCRDKTLNTQQRRAMHWKLTANSLAVQNGWSTVEKPMRAIMSSSTWQWGRENKPSHMGQVYRVMRDICTV